MLFQEFMSLLVIIIIKKVCHRIISLIYPKTLIGPFYSLTRSVKCKSVGLANSIDGIELYGIFY